MNLTKKNIVFTGNFKVNRGYWQQQCLRVGANLKPSVDKKTHYVVCGKNPCWKINQAQKENVEILNIEQAVELFQTGKPIESKLPTIADGRIQFDPGSTYIMRKFAQGSSRILQPHNLEEKPLPLSDETWDNSPFKVEKIQKPGIFQDEIYYNIKSDLRGEAGCRNDGIRIRTHSKWSGQYLQKVYDWVTGEWFQQNQNNYFASFYCLNFHLVQNSLSPNHPKWIKPALNPVTLKELI